MAFVLSILLELLPTIIVGSALARRIPFKSRLPLLVLAWFLGQVLLTTFVYLLSCALTPFTSNVLYKASISALLGCFCLLFLSSFRTVPVTQLPQLLRRSASDGLMAVATGVVSWGLFSSHLAYQDGKVLRSPVYWDLGYQSFLIQSFVFGDNFPPQSYTYAGVPLTYHFGALLNMSIYASLGLEFAAAINFCSILSLSLLLLGLLGLAEEFFSSSAAGILAMVLTLGGSALRTDLYNEAFLKGPSQFLDLLLSSNMLRRPELLSFSPTRAFGYNGMMFNLFYFIEERQLLIASIFLITALSLMWHCENLKKGERVLLGGLLATFFYWHFFVALLGGVTLAVLTLVDGPRRKALLHLLVPFTLIFGLEAALAWHTTHSMEFRTDLIDRFPRFSYAFASMPAIHPPSLLSAVTYWIYAYGFKLVVFAAAVMWMRKAYPRELRYFLALILPAFALVNTLEISPTSIYDNHKWLRPMNLFVDVLCALGLVKLFSQHGVGRRALAIMLLLVLALPGLIENAPFFLNTPSVEFAEYPTAMMQTVREKSRPNDVFLASDSKPILLAGRRMYVRFDKRPENPRIASDHLVRGRVRMEAAKLIYSSQTIEELCRSTQAAGIRFVQHGSDLVVPLRGALFDSFLPFSVEDQPGHRIAFLDMEVGCRLNSF